MPVLSWVCHGMAEWVEWYGRGIEGFPDIKTGRGSVEDIVSHTREVHRSLDAHQLQIAARARANLESRARRRSGSFQIGTLQPPQTMLDRYVYLSDTGEDNWWQSAVSLEMGHWTGKRGAENRTWVPGMWILHDAAGIRHS